MSISLLLLTTYLIILHGIAFKVSPIKISGQALASPKITDPARLQKRAEWIPVCLEGMTTNCPVIGIDEVLLSLEEDTIFRSAILWAPASISFTTFPLHHSPVPQAMRWSAFLERLVYYFIPNNQVVLEQEQRLVVPKETTLYLARRLCTCITSANCAYEQAYIVPVPIPLPIGELVPEPPPPVPKDLPEPI